MKFLNHGYIIRKYSLSMWPAAGHKTQTSSMRIRIKLQIILSVMNKLPISLRHDRKVKLKHSVNINNASQMCKWMKGMALQW